MAAREAHNLKVVGSNPTPATKIKFCRRSSGVEQRIHKPWVGRSNRPAGTRKIWVRGVARLTRLPVTEKIEGSNPFGPACYVIKNSKIFMQIKHRELHRVACTAIICKDGKYLI